ncbi:MAG: discoidin domain-containing protein [Anaerohalosphaeraceae bacterium]
MRHMFGLLFVSILAASVSCKKQPPVADVANPVVNDQSQTTRTSAGDNLVANPPEQIVATAGSEELVAIPLILPRPQFVGTDENLLGIVNLDIKPKGWIQPPFMAPKGVVNVALNKPVTGSESDPIMGELTMITDGDKEATDGSVVELGPFSQWVQVDLGEPHDIYAVAIWHYHRQARIYFDVIVQVSDDPEFVTGITTLFNSDTDNSSGQGVGQDKNYVDDSNGLLVNAKGVKGRYVRCYSNGNYASDMNHYIEIEVYGRK